MKFEDVEKARAEYRSKVMRGIWIAFVVVIIISLIVSLGGTNTFILNLIILSAMVAVFTAIVLVFTTKKQSKQYQAAYKAYFVKKNLDKVFTNIKYDHERGIAREILRATEMINTGDVYKSNDLVLGKYKDVAFAQADVHIQEEHTDSEGNTTYATIFKGRFMIYEFPKKFNFRLEVAEKYFGANRVPGKNRKTGRKFERIKLESGEFNKMFKTYAEDGFEAFYLLDPAFIHNILELGQEYKGKLLLCFLENKLVVGLKDGKDAFEPPSIFKKLDETVESEKIAGEMRIITNFVDKLKLDRKLFQ